MWYLSGKSYSSELCAAYLPGRGKRLLRYTTCTFLTRVTYSVTTVPLTSGRISLGNFETTQYREDNCYFVVKITLIYSNGSTRPTIKYQALVISFPRLEHLYQRVGNKWDIHVSVFSVQCLPCKQEVTPSFSDIIIMFIVYTTSLVFQWYQVQVVAPPPSPSNTCMNKPVQISCM